MGLSKASRTPRMGVCIHFCFITICVNVTLCCFQTKGDQDGGNIGSKLFDDLLQLNLDLTIILQEFNPNDSTSILLWLKAKT